MMRYTQGNLLESNAEALVNTVNTVGVSGKGIALMFKESFPENFRAYEAMSKAGHLAPGGLFITERHDMLGPRFIINFATKQHWRNPSRLEWISQGLEALRREITARGIRSIAIPPLGAGNGGLAWADVRKLIDASLADLDAEIIIYEPTPAYQNVVKRHGVERLTPARALLAEMIRRYAILGFECSILEAQKLAWFLRRGAEVKRLENPIGDDFVAHRYGPYADSVRHLLDSMDGSYIACDTRIADAKPFDPLRFNDSRREHVAAYLTTPEAGVFRPALEWATTVIDGFQSPYGMELLSTLDWLHQREAVPMELPAMMAAIPGWPGPQGAGERKARIFPERDVGIAIQHLLGISSTAGED
jgi:O-acetyl-ADP-ribose deacetylase (regulator of RNase III)